MPDRITYADFKSMQFQILYRDTKYFHLLNESFYQAPPLGKETSTFCLLLKGRVTFTTEDGTVTAQEGDLVYLPDGIHYSSYWTGEPDIEFISTFFRLTGVQSQNDAFSDEHIFKHPIRPIDQQIAFQNIKALGNFRMEKQMRELLTLNHAQPANLLRALSILYDIFSQVYPYLEMRKSKQYPNALEPALSHIHAHYTKNESVSNYARMCHLSESRFYHLFRQHMKSTPVEYRNTLRIRQAAHLLMDTNQSIEQISSLLGFDSAIYFRRVFKALYGVSPSNFRKATQV